MNFRKIILLLNIDNVENNGILAQCSKEYNVCKRKRFSGEVFFHCGSEKGFILSIIKDR